MMIVLRILIIIMTVCQNAKILNTVLFFYPDGEGAVRMVRMVGG